MPSDLVVTQLQRSVSLLSTDEDRSELNDKGGRNTLYPQKKPLEEELKRGDPWLAPGIHADQPQLDGYDAERPKTPDFP